LLSLLVKDVLSLKQITTMRIGPRALGVCSGQERDAEDIKVLPLIQE